MTNFQGPPRPKTPTHSKITSSPKHTIPYENPWISYKNHKNINLAQITLNIIKILKSHQTPPKHPNHTKHHQNTQITPNTTKPPKSHQTPSAILPLPTPTPKYLSRARPSQNRRACEIWVGHALQKEGPLQEKKNMVTVVKKCHQLQTVLPAHQPP